MTTSRSTDERGRYSRFGSDTVYTATTVNTASVDLTLAANTCAVWLFNNGASKLYFRTDGTAPTATNGAHPIPTGQRVILDVDGAVTVKVIGDASGETSNLLSAEIQL